MPQIEELAKSFATSAHEGQVRKYTGEPYINHCAEVVAILKTVGATEDQIAAGWLHDTVEDCGVSLHDLHMLFSENIVDMVENLTDVSKPSDGCRAVRKAIDLEHTAAASPDAKTIKLADLISNTGSIVARDPDFAPVYLKEKRALLKVLTEGNQELWATANCICE